MMQINSLNSTSNAFSFDLKTSSGDEISLSLYDNKSIEFNAKESSSERSFSMRLRHELGYSFSYKGDGISEQDQKEIEEAMKKIKPIYQKFLENIKKSDENPGFEEITNFSQIMRSKMPKLESPDAKELLKDKTVDVMDEVLDIFERSQKLLENTKRLFDKLFENMDGFDFYA